MDRLNKNIEQRDKIIFGKYRASAYKFDGRRKFEHLTHSQLVRLLEEGYANPESRVGNSPLYIQVCDFIEKYPVYMANGYAVGGADEDDYGVYINGVECGEPAESGEEFQDYMALFGGFDEFDEATMYCMFEG